MEPNARCLSPIVTAFNLNAYMAADPDKKIHIDEDWKTQVEREKEAAKQAATQSGSTTQATPAEPSSAEQAARQRAAETTGQSQPYGEPAPEKTPSRRTDPAHDYELPPASLAFLITTLGTQALVALGDVPNPITGKVERQPKQTKHFIDTLAMLEEKTQGNRTPEESALLNSLLHQLRMAYVSAGAPS
jgi:Domain of unknown function (DUF1844)